MATAFPSTTTVEIRRHPKTRRLTLRLMPQGDGIRVTVPPRVSQREIERFLARHQDWIASRLAARPEAVPFREGATIGIEGEPHVIALSGTLRGMVRREKGALIVPGAAAHVARRVRDYLKAEARRRLEDTVAEKCRAAGRRAGRITVRDTTTRWGSCSPSGALSFSWRLIMAPPIVLDYVAGHEVAHLVYLDHSPKFWAVCRDLARDMDSARAWLVANGAALHRVG